MEKPWKDSLWMDCFFEQAKIAKETGLDEIEFAEVDRLVIEKSKGISEYKVATIPIIGENYAK